MDTKILMISALTLTAGMVYAQKQKSGHKQPNILLIIVDDMGYSDVGCFGSEISTPNIDALAKEGLRYTHFYNTGRSWPTRTSIITGYYYPAVRGSSADNRPEGWSRTIAQMLSPHGYRTYHSGKWHVTSPIPQPYADGGFDRSMRIGNVNTHLNNTKNFVNDKPEEYKGNSTTSSGIITDYMLADLDDHRKNYSDKPFFAYVAYIQPHFPLQAEQKDIDKYRYTYTSGWDVMRQQRLERMKQLGIADNALPELEAKARWRYQSDEKTLQTLGVGEALAAVPWNTLTSEQKEFQATKMAIHAAMVTHVDLQVGRIIDKLKQMGELDNTVIFFLSDNGASAEILVRGEGHDKEAPMGSKETFLCLGPGFASLCNTPLRRSKIWVHEGGISTPLIVRWGNGIKSTGQIRTTQGHVVDIVPTILDIAGGIDPGKDFGTDYPKLHGISLVPSFYDDNIVKHDFIYFNHSKNYALIEGDWKLVAADIDGKQWQLYNLADDRGETNDLSAKYPEKVEAMSQKWTELTKGYIRQNPHEIKSQLNDSTMW